VAPRRRRPRRPRGPRDTSSQPTRCTSSTRHALHAAPARTRRRRPRTAPPGSGRHPRPSACGSRGSQGTAPASSPLPSLASAITIHSAACWPSSRGCRAGSPDASGPPDRSNGDEQQQTGDPRATRMYVPHPSRAGKPLRDRPESTAQDCETNRSCTVVLRGSQRCRRAPAGTIRRPTIARAPSRGDGPPGGNGRLWRGWPARRPGEIAEHGGEEVEPRASLPAAPTRFMPCSSRRCRRAADRALRR
jgi:hypothetical protein